MNKDALKGAGLGLVAAYVFGCLFILFSARGEIELSQFFLGGLVGLIFSFWFVIPIGMILGVLIPKLFAHRSAPAAVAGGALSGFAGGCLGGLLFYLFLNWFGITTEADKNPLLYFSLIMGIYCAPWTSAYAYLRLSETEELH